MLSAKFARFRFEELPSATSLSSELAVVLTRRLRLAPDPQTEAALIVEDLKNLGHDIYSWDASPGAFEIWGDSYISPVSKKRLCVTFRFSSDELPNAEVEFGPWPLPE